MIFEIDSQTRVDTDTDLEPEERHILQKILCWKVACTSMAQFREKCRAAFHTGWNDSGPVSERPIMSAVIKHLEIEIHQRLISKKEE